MKKVILFLFTTCSFLNLFSQEFDLAVVDSLYREDQFYIGVTYNLLQKSPNGLSQNGFSGGYHLGFIRDMPINEERNLSFGLGLGLSLNSYNQNLLINRNNVGDITFNIIEDNNTFTKNKFSQYLVEIPFEFRWRTSTPISYKFWRIYTGFKLGYVFAHTTKYKGDLGTIKYSDINDFENLQYGITLSVGYNTWNIHCYYLLNPIFSDYAQSNGENIDMRAIKIGLIFYIL